MFDIVFTCEERCFDAVCMDLQNRGSRLNKLVHVINVDIKDNHEQAAVGGKGILDLASRLTQSSDVDSEINTILDRWQFDHRNLPALHQVCFF